MYLSQVKSFMQHLVLFMVTTIFVVAIPVAIVVLKPHAFGALLWWVLEAVLVVAFVAFSLMLILATGRLIESLRFYWRVRRLLLNGVDAVLIDVDLMLEFTQDFRDQSITVLESTLNGEYIEYQLTPWGEVYVGNYKVTNVSRSSAPTYLGNAMHDLLKRIPISQPYRP